MNTTLFAFFTIRQFFFIFDSDKQWLNAHQIKIYCLIVYKIADLYYLFSDTNYHAWKCIGKDKLIGKKKKKRMKKKEIILAFIENTQVLSLEILP